MPRPVIEQQQILRDEEPTVVAASKYRALRHTWDLRGPETALAMFSYMMSRRDRAAEDRQE